MVSSPLSFSFQKPHPICFTRRHLEEMEIIFLHYGKRPGMEDFLPGWKTVAEALVWRE